jgi:hypothetical protein
VTDVSPPKLTQMTELVANRPARVDRPGQRIDCDGQDYPPPSRNERDGPVPGIVLASLIHGPVTRVARLQLARWCVVRSPATVSTDIGSIPDRVSRCAALRETTE